MKRSLAALLIASMLLGQTELHQLARLPHLVHHFLDHKAERPSITFFDFIVVHYFSGNVHDEDFAQDERLPFRSHDDHITIHSAQDLFHAPIPVVVHCLPTVPVTTEHPATALHPGERSDVWQPPRA